MTSKLRDMNTFHPELPGQVPVFFPDDAPGVVSEVAIAPLHLDRQPFEYNPISPTPLDAENLIIHGGLSYAFSARHDMQRQLHENVGKLECEVDSATVDIVRDEIDAQHTNRIYKNSTALEVLQTIDARVELFEAERIMRIRAGIGGVAAPLWLLSKYPQLGGIEIMKATRPFSLDGIQQAKALFLYRLRKAPFDVVELDVTHEAPYRSVHTDESRIVIVKIRIARAVMSATETSDRLLMDIVARDSYVALGQDEAPLLPVVKTDLHGETIRLVPVDTTIYCRPANKEL